ncbi:MAG TPA: glycosyl hydrolase family 28-related protein [Verrucomicrobiae bacterium]|nr:glycosyl hydrolase family 28-related protein [Verrucomicrobiae bacterium]
MKQLILSLLLCSVASAAPDSPQWKIIKTKYPTPDVVVAGYNVLDFGALGDGKTDCTEAFQQAMDNMRNAGGGTVFVPEGRYVIKGTLQIPTSVTLRGEWAGPTSKSFAVKGTVLMAYAGRGETNGTPFISVNQCAGIKDLSIWYPEQTAQDIVAYPYCLIQTGGDNATFENLTLVNPYQGIRIGPGGNELHFVHNVYGTPLSVGVRYHMTTDIGRLENIHFSPDYWCKSGLPNAPDDKGSFADWLLANGTAIYMERSDWEYVAYVFIDGYNRGFLMTAGAARNGRAEAANAQIYGMVINNCQTAVDVRETNPYGVEFAKCTFDGREYGFRLGSRFTSAILLNECDVSAEQALYSEGSGCFIMQNSRITHGNIALTGGVLAMTDSKIEDAKTQISLGANVRGASLVGNTFARGSPPIKSELAPEKLFVSDKPVKLDPFPKYDGNKSRVELPAREVLYVVTDAPWNANGRGEQDDTLAIQKALAQAGKDGGGIVFVPGGNYIIRDSLVVPSGAELRGVYDVPHHTVGGGSMLHIYPGTNQNPSVVVLARAGLRGLTFNYPDQSAGNWKEYPFLIQGHGEDLYIINVNCGDPYQFLDLKTWRCDRHYVDYLSGSPVRVGIAVGGGSTDGEVRNVMFNTHYWTRVMGGNPFFASSAARSAFGAVWSYQKENLDAIWVGNCKREFLYQNFAYGSLYGIHFTEQDGHGPEDCIVHGHGTDGSKTGVYFERGTGRIDLVNSELVSMSSSNKVVIKLGPDFHGTARLINTMVWGDPSTLAQVDNGSLWLLGLHATQFGNGLQINQGEVTAVNVNYTGRVRSGHPIHLGLNGPKAKATLIGCITQGELVVTDNSTEAGSQVPKPVLIGNVTR